MVGLLHGVRYIGWRLAGHTGSVTLNITIIAKIGVQPASLSLKKTSSGSLVEWLKGKIGGHGIKRGGPLEPPIPTPYLKKGPIFSI